LTILTNTNMQVIGLHEEKMEIRRRILQLRNTLVREEIEEKSRRIRERILDLPQYARSKVVMGYMDFRNEVMTRKLLEECFHRGKRIVIPIVSDEDGGPRRLILAEITSLREGLKLSPMGILEPEEGNFKVIPPEVIDLMIVPGVAFDRKKFRLGYGGGYYDRLLRQVGEQCVAVGVAFELQLLEELPVEPFDMPVDMVVTENSILL
jgi:5-formyltetrahydrofolate cyclo-ligase